MANKYNKDLKLLVHPYVFILREGQTIKRDFLDYNLVMLKVCSPEVLRSPGQKESFQMRIPVFAKDSVSTWDDSEFQSEECYADAD